MPTALRGWAIWGAVQLGLTYAIRLLIKLADNAVMGWGDDRIAEFFGITSPNASTVFNWAVPFVVAAIALWVFYYFTTRPLREALAKQSGGDLFSAVRAGSQSHTAPASKPAPARQRDEPATATAKPIIQSSSASIQPFQHEYISWAPARLGEIVQVETSRLTGEPMVTLIKMYGATCTSSEPLLKVEAYVTPQLGAGRPLRMVFYDPHTDLSQKMSILPREEFHLYYDFRPFSEDKQGLSFQNYLNTVGGITIAIKSDEKVVFQRSFSYSDIKQMLIAEQDNYLAKKRIK